jgi:hypothetical protein
MTDQQQQPMTLDAFRQAKQSGVDLTQEAQVDAAPNSAEGATTVDSGESIEGQEEGFENVSEGEINTPDDGAVEHDDLPQIPQDQQTAWQKRAERERRKAYEEAETKLKAEYESQLNPYKSFFDSLGLDPKQAMEALERNKLNQEAQQLAYANGWTEDQAQMYVRQQELERKQTEMQVNLRVYELADTKDYPGIKEMKGAITDFVRSNPRASVEQAYYAVGGQALVQQMKREAEQREIQKRTQTKRTVITDVPTDMKGPAPLTADAEAFMRRTGMSEAQVRMLMQDQGPKNLDEYRKFKKTK